MKVQPIRTPDRDFLLWFAGFMDGEGSFIVSANTQRRSYGEYPSFIRSVQVTSTTPNLLEAIRDEFQAGKVSPLKDFVSYKRNPLWKPAWRLSWHSDQSRDIAAILRPILRIKSEQASIVADWPNKKRGGNHLTGRDLETHAVQHALYERMKALNKRGV